MLALKGLLSFHELGGRESPGLPSDRKLQRSGQDDCLQPALRTERSIFGLHAGILITG